MACSFKEPVQMGGRVTVLAAPLPRKHIYTKVEKWALIWATSEKVTGSKNNSYDCLSSSVARKVLNYLNESIYADHKYGHLSFPRDMINSKERR